MSKMKKHSIYCMNCDWELRDTHRNTDAWKCPKCKDGLIMPGKREEMNKKKLIDEFTKAKNDEDYRFIILEIVAEGIKEFIVVPRESFEEKLAFYKRSYTDELVHVMNKNVLITKFSAVKHILTNELFL